ncbi:MAG: hypothetical protein VYC80_06905, partial [Planctomycetota bacterium]|nr:hypothetical protein [Planctomycetota bacterium]
WSYQLSRVPKSRPLFSKFTYRFGLADSDIFPQAQSQWEVVSPGLVHPESSAFFISESFPGCAVAKTCEDGTRDNTILASINNE